MPKINYSNVSWIPVLVYNFAIVLSKIFKEEIFFPQVMLFHITCITLWKFFVWYTEWCHCRSRDRKFHTTPTEGDVLFCPDMNNCWLTTWQANDKTLSRYYQHFQFNGSSLRNEYQTNVKIWKRKEMFFNFIIFSTCIWLKYVHILYIYSILVKI